MTNWFTSDTHYGHTNIIKYTDRPFKSLYHMDSTLIKNHNSRVKPNDTVYHLGDFCFKNSKGGKEGEGALHKASYYLKQLNGRFVFIRGNHDTNNSLKTILFSGVIEHGGQLIYLVHRPTDMEPSFPINFVGHVHEKWLIKKEDKTLLYNVGVDMNNFMPIDINEIMNNIRKWRKENGMDKR